MGRRSIPDRWLAYKPIGERIPGTKFIAFKVPLKEGVVKGLPQNERFTTQALMESLPNLGLVIDLTNTDRYYNRQDFLGQGILYEKIFCRGHEIPNQSVVDKFFSAVNKYFEHHQSSDAENGDDKLIGVHCTHGLNRTGYLVCRYMIQRMGFTPEDAITAFEEARGYPMEREEYLKSLRRTTDSPKKAGSSGNGGEHSNQDGSQNKDDPTFSGANGFPHHRQGTWTRSAPVQARDLKTGGFVDFCDDDDVCSFPANESHGGFRRFYRGNRRGYSWPGNYRGDYGNNFANSSRSYGASNHSYRWPYDTEQHGSKRFREQDFDSRRSRYSEYSSGSDFALYRNNGRHRDNWRD